MRLKRLTKKRAPKPHPVARNENALQNVLNNRCGKDGFCYRENREANAARNPEYYPKKLTTYTRSGKFPGTPHIRGQEPEEPGRTNGGGGWKYPNRSHTYEEGKKCSAAKRHRE